MSDLPHHFLAKALEESKTLRRADELALDARIIKTGMDRTLSIRLIAARLACNAERAAKVLKAAGLPRERERGERTQLLPTFRRLAK